MKPEIPLQRMMAQDETPGPWITGARRPRSAVNHAPELIGVALGMAITLFLAFATMIALSHRGDRDALPARSARP